MKHFYIILIALFLGIGARAQTTQPFSSCLPQGITFSTQTEIDHFQTNYPGCTGIEGNVTINGDNITNLNGLNGLTFIGGSLNINGNNALTSLTGLDNLTSIGDELSIFGNGALSSLTGLENLSFIGNILYIFGNNALTSLTGLQNLTSLEEGLTLFYNDALVSLTGLKNLTSIGNFLSIGGNNTLTSLTGLENLASIGGAFSIGKNNALTSLTGLENLTSIGGALIISENNSITSLTGLENINAGTITNVKIFDNPTLSDCAIQSICEYLAAPNGVFEIHGNATGCNSQEEVEEACIYLSAGDLTIQSSLPLFPNPASKTITIESAGNSMPQKNIWLTISDLNGRQLIQRAVTEPQTVVDVSGLSSGVHFMKVISDNGVKVGKFVKE